MLFWIFVALLIGCIVWWVWAYNDDNDSIIGAILLTFVMTIIVIASTIGIVYDHASADAYIASGTQTYESLVYQYENNLYDNDNDLGKKELMDQIQEWNETLAKKRELQDNFWVGIYHPNIYDQLDFIDLENPGLVPIRSTEDK